jgi:TPR repeat protein
MYRTGMGVVQDHKEAVRWYRKAADQGDAAAQFNLALMYANGQGVAQDYKEAVKWYRKSAEQGVAAAQSNLGLMYSDGTGVLNDNVRAHMWYNVAGANGNKIGADNRVIIEKRMTPAQIAEAQKLAREWMEKHP